MTLMGAGILWVGWFGFNAGSTVQSGLDTARALTMTQISAASGALTWMIDRSLDLPQGHLLGIRIRHPGRPGGHHSGRRCGAARRRNVPWARIGHGLLLGPEPQTQARL